MSTLGISAPALLPTPTTVAQQLIDAIGSSQAQQATLEQQISSGFTVNQPSDNPALAAQVITLNASLTRAQQYVANANDAQGWLRQGNSTVNQALSALQSIQSAVESVSGQALTGQATATQAIADQVAGGLQQLLGLANTTYDGQAIFAGTSAKAYSADGAYLGSAGTPTRTVAPGVTVGVAVPGTTIFGDGNQANPPGSGAGSGTTWNILGTGAGGTQTGVIQQIVNDLRAGNLSAATGQDLQHLQQAITQVEGAAGQLGADYQNIQAFTAQATATQQALQTEIGNAQDVNLAQATTQLTQAQQSYQAALWATSQTVQASLVQFLS